MFVFRNLDERIDPAKTAAKRLRLTKDFSDDYGSYSAGDEFDVYPYGGVSPGYATVVAPGRECTLQVPWDSVEVCEAEDEQDAEDERYEELKGKLFSGSPMKRGELEELVAAAKARGDRKVESALENVVDDDAPAPEEKLGDGLVSEALGTLRMMY